MNEPQVITIGMGDPVTGDRKLIDVSSKGRERWRLLSPSIQSNVFCYSSLSSVCMQNAWVYSQVYEEMDDNGVPTEDWYVWRDRGFARKHAVYYPMGGIRDLKPLYCFWNDFWYGKLEARKYVFCPLYLRSIKNSQQMKQLHKMYRDGVKLALRDFDAYPLEGRTYEEALHDLSKPFSHALILLNELEKE